MEDHAQAADGCRLLPALDDLDLIAAIDGEADADVMAHLRVCQYCAARAHAFAELQGLLRKQFYRMFCPTSDALVAFQQGMLEGGQRAEIAAHVVDCPHCSRELQLLRQITGESSSGRAPPSLWNLMNIAKSNGGAAAGKLRQVQAELLTPAPTSLAEAYGALRGPSHTTQYAYHAENLQITLGVRRVAQRADRRVVVGVLTLDDDLPEGMNQATAILCHQNTLVSTAELDELGNFVLDDLAPGTYRLSLRLPDREIIIEALAL